MFIDSARYSSYTGRCFIPKGMRDRRHRGESAIPDTPDESTADTPDMGAGIDPVTGTEKGVTSDDSDNVIRKDLLELSDIIVRHPAVPSQICKIMDDQLQGGISRETYERIVLSLRVLVGHAPTRIITESSKILNDGFFDQIERSNPEAAESGTIRFLRELTGEDSHP